MDYKNGKIYRVVCSETGRQYIGSTASTLVKRLYNHKRKTNACSTKDFIEPKIFLIEDYPCDRKDQLLSRERFHIESMDCVNKNIPTRTQKEYREDNKKHVKEYQKDYYQNNKDKIKEYYEVNKDKLKIQKKEYRNKNKEKLKIKKKEYYEKNKETLFKNQKANFTCECGATTTRGNKSQHFKTKKHIKFLHTTPA